MPPRAETAIEYSQEQAIQLMGLPSEYLEMAVDLQRITNNPYLGSFVVGQPGDEKIVHAYRAHSGSEFNQEGKRRIAKGGLRQVVEYVPDLDTELIDAMRGRDIITDRDPGLMEHQQEVCRLGRIMLHKVAELGREEEYRGGKGLFVIQTDQIEDTSKPKDQWRPRRLTPEEEEEAMRKYHMLMDTRGYAKHDFDVPAGDVGIGLPLLDIYADQHAKTYPKDPYKNAVITGTSPKYDGWDEKIMTTSLGLYAAHRQMNREFDGAFRNTVVQGFGAVGAYYAYFASHDEGMRILGISDVDGFLYTEDPAGMEITKDMAEQVMAERYRKMPLLKRLVEHNQPGLETDIKGKEHAYDFGADVFTPAALGGDLDPINADRLYRAGVKLVNEGANEPTTMAGHMALSVAGIRVIPDIVANSEGVEGSFLQHKEAMRRVDRPNDPAMTGDELLERVEATGESLTKKINQVAHDLGTEDLRAAALAVSTARLFVANNVSVPSDVKQLAAA